jgi:ribonuclease HIII
MTQNKKSSCFTATISLDLASKLQKDLENQGFSITHPPYTVFGAIKKGVSVNLYQSGKLTVQGKEKDEFIEFYLEPEILKTFFYSHPEQNLDLTARIGVDEAGKGDFFGPLCTCALYADSEGIKELFHMGVKDSKRMTDSAVIKLGQKIEEKFPHAIVRLFPAKYNELYTKFRNLNYMLAWTHAAAISEVFDKTSCDNVLIDKFAAEHVVEDMLRRKKVDVRATQKTKAEEDVVVAAASIVARKEFLLGLKNLEEKFSVKLPKGASSLVLDAGKTILSEKGLTVLDQVCKSHFKTRMQILGRYEQPDLTS